MGRFHELLNEVKYSLLDNSMTTSDLMAIIQSFGHSLIGHKQNEQPSIVRWLLFL